MAGYAAAGLARAARVLTSGGEKTALDGLPVIGGM
jgi:copper homeostasis protein CutC